MNALTYCILAMAFWTNTTLTVHLAEHAGNAGKTFHMVALYLCFAVSLLCSIIASGIAIAALFGCL